MAVTRDRGNIGYAGVLHAQRRDFLAFFFALSWFVVGVGLVLLLLCGRYFANHPATRTVEW